MESKEYFPGIDTLKGILILFVIVGHLLYGSIDRNIVRFLIYSFHMPLFIAVSGFLLKGAPLYILSYRELLCKYWKRMLFPWGFSLVFYVVVMGWGGRSVKSLCMAFLYPPYHLWFIRSLFFMILGLKFFLGFKWRLSWLFCLGSAFTIMWRSYLHDLVGDNWWLDKGSLVFFVYFLFGYLLRSGSLVGASRSVVKGVTLCLFLIYILSFFICVAPVVEASAKVFGNFGLAWLVLSSNWLKNSSENLLGALGRISLPLYLWHIVFLSLAGKLCDIWYCRYALSFVFLACLCVILIKLDRGGRRPLFIFGW